MRAFSSLSLSLSSRACISEEGDRDEEGRVVVMRAGTEGREVVGERGTIGGSFEKVLEGLVEEEEGWGGGGLGRVVREGGREVGREGAVGGREVVATVVEAEAWEVVMEEDEEEVLLAGRRERVGWKRVRRVVEVEM